MPYYCFKKNGKVHKEKAYKNCIPKVCPHLIFSRKSKKQWKN